MYNRELTGGETVRLNELLCVTALYELPGKIIAQAYCVTSNAWYYISTVTGWPSPKEEKTMRQSFAQVETREEAEIECPWACEIIEVEGGWMCFESADDAATWAAQE